MIALYACASLSVRAEENNQNIDINNLKNVIKTIWFKDSGFSLFFLYEVEWKIYEVT